MFDVRRALVSLCWVLGACALGQGCDGDGKRPIGGSCGEGEDCQSGICGGGLCLDPASDDDGDGLVNGVEVALGSDPSNADSDGDMVDDAAEIADDLTGIDTDGDGLYDVVESAVHDTDGDCIPDQYDAQDTVVNGDLSPMRDVVCASSGPCLEQRAALTVACPGGRAVCVYDRIEGYADPEIACDGVDENCDGETDEGFVAGCDDFDRDGVADGDDVCPEDVDPAQADADDDGVGDACAGRYLLSLVDVPVTATAGVPFTVHGAIERVAPSQSSAPLPAWHGVVSFDDEGAPIGQATAADGVFSAEVTMTIAGDRLPRAVASIGEASWPIEVDPGPLARIAVEAPTSVVAGAPFGVTARAQDDAGNLVALDGAATIASDDGAAELPTGALFVAGELQVDGVVLHTAGQARLTIGAGGLTGDADIDVTVGAPAALRVEVAASVKAGVAAPLRVSAVDGSGNILPDVSGAVAIACDDARATCPASATLIDGQATFEVVFGTAGVATIDAHLPAAGGHGALEGSATTGVRAGAPGAITLETATSVTAGVGEPLRVEIRDAFGNVADDPADAFTGTVTLAADSPRAPGPTSIAFVAADRGAKEATLDWLDAGAWTLVASAPDLTAASVAVEVAAGPATALGLTLPATARAGDAVPLEVRALDAAGNVATDWVGTLQLSDDDAFEDVPAAIELRAIDAGRRTIPVTFGEAGTRRVTVTGAGLASADATIAISAGAARAVALTGPAVVAAETPIAVHVAIVDRYGQVADAPPSVGTVSFGHGDTVTPFPSLPGPLTLAAADGSEGDIAITWHRAGPSTVNAAAAGLTTGTLAVTVGAGGAASLDIALAATAKAGVATPVTVSVRDAAGNLDVGFEGTITLGDDDALSDLPASVVLGPDDGGTRTLAVTFGEVGTTRIDASAGALTGQAETLVRAGAPHHLALGATGPTIAGVARDVHVSARDRFDNVADDPAGLYLGTVTFDVTGSLPATAPKLPGATVFGTQHRSERDVSTTWYDPGTFTLRATGTGLAVPTATLDLTVATGPVARLSLTAPVGVQAGVPFALEVAAVDAAGNTVPSFTGTVALTSDDAHAQAVVPASVVFAAGDAGHKSVAVTLVTLGDRALSASAGALAGSAVTTVGPGPAVALRLTSPPGARAGIAQTVHVAAVDAFGNVANNAAAPYLGTVSFSQVEPVTNPAPALPATFTFAEGDGGEKDVQVTFFLAATRTLRAIGTALTTPIADLSFAVAAGAATALALDVPATMIAGTPANATVTAKDAWGNTDTGAAFSVSFTDSAGDTIPAVTLAAGTKVFALTLQHAGPHTLQAAAGSRHGQDTTSVGAGPIAAVAIDPIDALAVDDRAYAVHAAVVDAYGNVVTTFTGPLVPDLGCPGATPGLIDLVPADHGEIDFDVTPSEPGACTLTITGDTAALSGSLDFLVYSRSPSRLTIDAAPPMTVGQPPSPVLVVTLEDADGAAAIATSDVLVSLDLGYQVPRPTQLGGTTTATFAANTTEVMFDGYTVSAPGRYTLVASGSGLSAGDSPIFPVQAAAPTVTLDALTPRADGCVDIDFTLAQADGARSDIAVTFETDDVPMTTASQAADPGSDGTLARPPGSYRFTWNPTRDLPRFAGDVTMTLTATVGDRGLVPSSGTASTGTLPIDTDPGPTLAANALPAIGYGAMALGSVDIAHHVDVALARSDDRIELRRGDSTTIVSAPFAGSDIVQLRFVDAVEDDALRHELFALDGGGEVWQLDPDDLSLLDSRPVCGGTLPVDFLFHDLDDQAQPEMLVLCRQTFPFDDEKPLGTWEIHAHGADIPVATGDLDVLPTHAAIADMSKDGTANIVIAAEDTLIVLGGGLPDIEELQRATLPGVTRVALGDWDHDGRDEAFAIAGDEVWVLAGSALPNTPLDAPFDLGQPASDVAFFDADGDGLGDIVAVSVVGSGVSIARASAGFEWSDVPGAALTELVVDPGFLPGVGQARLGALHADGDGWSQLVPSIGGRCQPGIEAIEAAPPWLDKRAIATADLDDDGRLDLVADYGAYGIELAFGRGDGGYLPDIQGFGGFVPSANVASIAPGDFNHDGHVDIAFARTNGVVEVWAQSPTNPLDFEFLVEWDNAEPLYAPLDAADLDGDGYDDLVWAEPGFIVRAYQKADGSGFDNVADPVSGSAHSLDVGSVDDLSALDIVYYAREDVDSVVHHYLCSMFADVGGRRDYTTGCRDITNEIPQGERSSVELDQLEIEPGYLGSRRVFYRYSAGLLTPRLESRDVYALGQPGTPATTVPACSGGGPTSFSTGFFDADDGTADLAVSCAIDGAYRGDLVLRTFGASAVVDRLHARLGVGPIAAVDSDGDGLPEIVTQRGSSDARSESGDWELRAPLAIDLAGVEPQAVISADLNHDGLPEIIAAEVYDDFDTFVDVTLIAPDRNWAPTTWTDTVCSDCTAGRTWKVHLAAGDVDGDGLDDLVLFLGAAGERTSQLRILKATPDGALSLVSIGVPLNVPWAAEALAVGTLVRGSIRAADIVVAGTDINNARQIRVVHPTESGPIVFKLANVIDTPLSFGPMFIGTLNPTTGPGLMVVDPSREQVHAFVPRGCSTDGDLCLHLYETHGFYEGRSNFQFEGATLGRIDADTSPALVLAFYGIGEGSSFHYVTVLRFGQELFGHPDLEVLSERDFDFDPCSDGRTDCVPPALGPIVTDWDGDGIGDVLVGWNEGQVWERFDQGTASLAGGLAYPGKLAVAGDLDGTGLPEIVVLDRKASDRGWVLRR